MSASAFSGLDSGDLDSSNLYLIFEQAFKSRKSLISVTGRADVLKMLQSGTNYRHGNTATLYLVTP